MNKIYFMAAVMMAVVMVSCSMEGNEPEIHGCQNTTKVTLRVVDASGTRSSVDVADDAINNINIYAYRDGKLEAEVFKNAPSVVVMELIEGAVYNMYAVANTGPLTPPVNETGLASLSCRIKSIGALRNGLPMAWSAKGIYVDDDAGNIRVVLERLVSRIGFNVDTSLFDELEINSVQLKQSASVVRPFLGGGSFARTASEVIDGDFASEKDIMDVNDGETVFFYAMENIHGNLLPQNQDPWSKVPDDVGGRASLCTYLEVQCTFLSKSIYEGTVTYRFFVGDNNVTDFSIRRNTDVVITMCPTRSGLREISWKVDSDAKIRDGYAWGYIKDGFHGTDNLYIGEVFCYSVDISDELTEHFGGNLSGCTFEFVSDDGGSIRFDDYSSGNLSSYIDAYGTCCGEGTGEIWLCDGSGNRVIPVGDGFRIKKPKIVLSDRSTVPIDENDFAIDGTPRCDINSGYRRLHVYFTDDEGYNLNTDCCCGYDLSVFRFESEPCIESEYGIESTVAASFTAGISNSEGPAAIYDIICTNGGTDTDMNRNLIAALSASRAFDVAIDEINYGIGKTCSLCLDIPEIILKLVDNGWAKYGNTQLALKVDNPSNLPLNITGWQINRTNAKWNAISRNEIVDMVENEMTLTSVSYISPMFHESQLPLYGQSFSIYSERSEAGDSFIEDGNLMVYNISGVSTNEAHCAMLYDMYGHEALYHLVDVSMPGRQLYSHQVSMFDNLEDGSMEYSIIYGNDPENPGYNDQGIWLYSCGSLLSKRNASLDTYANVTAQTLSSLIDRQIHQGTYDLRITYDSSAGQLYASCPDGDLFGVRIDTYVSGTVKGYVETFPNGTWGSGKDNNCTATISGGVSGISVGSTDVSIDGGAIKAGMDAIYAQTFYDSKNWIGSANNYRHRAHPTSMTVNLKIKVSGSGGEELYPVTLTWKDTRLSYYHAQDDKTYSPTISKTMPLFNFVKVRKN